MNVWQIICGSLTLFSSLILIVLTLAQAKKQQDMSTALSGQSSDTFFGKNKGTSREDSLSSLTRIFAIIFFIVTIALNIIVSFSL